MPPSTFKQVFDSEIEHLAKIRPSGIDKDSLIGLAYSGGGIRSASFALGVMQALVRNGAMPKFDYLSTVSGGGYIGSSLTWLLHICPQYGLTPNDFPLRGPHEGARAEDATKKEAPPALDFIRQRGNYLTPGHNLNLVSMIAVVARGMISTFLVYFVLLTGLFFFFRMAGFFAKPQGAWVPGFVPGWIPDWPVLLGLLCAIGFVGLALLYAVTTKVPDEAWIRVLNRTDAVYLLRNFTQKWQGRLLIALLAMLVIGSLPLATPAIGELHQAVAAASLSTIVGAIGAIVKFVMDSQTGDTAKGPVGKIVIAIATMLLAYGTLLLSFATAVYLGETHASVAAILAAIVVAALIGHYTNFNYTSPHRMYRDRLMETFLPDLDAIRATSWRAATRADVEPLHEMCGARDPAAKYAGPYHLINTNVVLVNSENLKFRDRASDNFLLSPLWCGSDATGWIETKDYGAKTRWRPRRMTLASAMSISGAAANPRTGSAGRGLARNAIVSFLMSMLNLRLGYLELNPDERCRRAPPLPKRPNLFFPGLGELFSFGFTEDAHFIELTDGGHFDNTGIYELIRRRAKVIVMSDAGADDKYAFADISNALERVRVDFGANIRFRPKLDLCDIVPRKDDRSVSPDIGLAKRGYAIADIAYADESHLAERPKRILIVIKPTMIHGLPADLYGYKAANPTFPQQTTADQFFDETQFESYRELGYQLTKDMLERDDTVQQELGIAPPPAASARPAPIAGGQPLDAADNS